MANLFADGFESGNLTAWSASTTDGGDLSAHADAKLHGSCGLKLVIDDTNNIYLEDATPNSVKRYRARFYIDPNTLTMAAGEDIGILVGWNNAWSTIFNVQLLYESSAYKIYAESVKDTGSDYTNHYTITDAPHCIEIDWKASSAAGANNGSFELLIDGVSKQAIATIDNDTKVIDFITFGARDIYNASTLGTFYLDDFASNNDGGAIGLIVDSYDLSRTDGIKVGGTISETMAASVIRTDGMAAGSSTSELGTMTPTKTDGTKIGDKFKWSGLGLGVAPTGNDAWDWWTDRMLDNGFTELRMGTDYQNVSELAYYKSDAILVIAKGAKVIFGVSSNSFNNPDYTITSTNWPTFRQAILDAATWAQANGIYEFQLGNEEEWHVDGTTMTVAQIITNLKGVAAEAKAIFTRGNVSYSFSFNFISDWVAAGKGDIDLLGMNVYMESTNHYEEPWQDRIDTFVTAFPTGYITEFGPSTIGLAYYSSDEAVQAAAVKTMLDYIIASGITRAMFFQFVSDEFGAMNWDGSYKLLWYELIGGGLTMTASPVMTDGVKVGDSRLITALMSLLKTDGVVLSDARLIELIGAAFELLRTEGLLVGDSRLESMAASPIKTDGVKIGDSRLENIEASTVKTEGVRIGDTRLLELLTSVFELLRTEGLLVGDSRLENMAASPIKTDGVKIGDTGLLELFGAILLSIIDGLRMGDTKTISMDSTITKTDGIKVGDTITESMIANTVKTDGVKIGDVRTINALLSIIDELIIGDTPLLNANAFEVIRTDGFQIRSLIKLFYWLTLRNILTDWLKTIDDTELWTKKIDTTTDWSE